MKVYLGNAFSLQMIQTPATVRVVDVQPEQVPPEAVNIIGHEDTAVVAGSILGRDLHENRQSIELQPGDHLYVVQVMGGRLPNGATTLPENYTLKLLKVSYTVG